MTNHITNERGESVIAEGAPGSLARLRCEFPDTWGRRLTDDHLETLCLSEPPSHGAEVATSFGPNYIDPAWYIGEWPINGRPAWHYAASYMMDHIRYWTSFYTFEPLPVWVPRDLAALKTARTSSAVEGITKPFDDPAMAEVAAKDYPPAVFPGA